MLSNSPSTITATVDIWQCQTYWPIKGWAAPLSGTPHYSCSILPNGTTDSFPNDLPPPDGWKWSDDWALDTSMQYGTPDHEGWYYATSFDRLADAMRNSQATGIASATSTVRKRRWIRSLQCTSNELAGRMKDRMDRIVQIRVRIEASLKNKEECVKEVEKYEETRSKVFATSLQQATQNTLQSLGQLKDISSRLRLVKQYFHDRALMERDHSVHLEKLVQKYLPLANSEAGSEGGSAGGTNSSANALVTSKHQNAADIFFTHMYNATLSHAQALDNYSRSLLPLGNEVDVLYTEVQEVLKNMRARFRKTSDICRLSDSACGSMCESVVTAFKNAQKSAFLEVEKLSLELTCLRGGSAYYPPYYEGVWGGREGVSIAPPDGLQNVGESAGAGTGNVASLGASATDRNSKKSGGSAEKAKSQVTTGEDFFLSVQRYKISIRDAQEALSSLVSLSMDLSLQQEIFHNRSHILLHSLFKRAGGEDLSLYADVHERYHKAWRETVKGVKAVGLPYPHIKSPFAKLRAPPTPSTPSNAQSQSSDVSNASASSSEYEDFAHHRGVFAFTYLYSHPLPASPGVVRSGPLFMAASPSAHSHSAPGAWDGLEWMEVYVVLSSDDYLHVWGEGGITDMPQRSFNLKQCTLREWNPSSPPPLLTPPPFPAFELHVHTLASTSSFHTTSSLPSPAARPAAPASSPRKRLSRGGAANVNGPVGVGGVVFRGYEDGKAHGLPSVFAHMTALGVGEGSDAKGDGEVFSWAKALRSAGYGSVWRDEYVDNLHTDALQSSLSVVKGEREGGWGEEEEEEGWGSDDDEHNDDGEDGAEASKDQEEETNRDNPANESNTAEDREDRADSGGGSDTSSDYGDMEEEREEEERRDKEAAGAAEDVDNEKDEDAGQRGRSDEDGVSTAGEASHPHARPALRSAHPRPAGQGRSSSATSATSSGVRTGVPAMNKTASIGGGSYVKKDASWIRTSAEGPAGGAVGGGKRSVVVGMVPVATELNPPRLIPVLDKELPLAKRHSQMIEKYEQGLNEEREKSTRKVKENKEKRVMRDFGDDDVGGALGSSTWSAAPSSPMNAGEENASSSGGGLTAMGGSMQSMTDEKEAGDTSATSSAAASTSAKRGLGVKRLSQMFDAQSVKELHAQTSNSVPFQQEEQS